MVRFAIARGLVPGYPWEEWPEELGAGTGAMQAVDRVQSERCMSSPGDPGEGHRDASVMEGLAHEGAEVDAACL